MTSRRGPPTTPPLGNSPFYRRRLHFYFISKLWTRKVECLVRGPGPLSVVSAGRVYCLPSSIQPLPLSAVEGLRGRGGGPRVPGFRPWSWVRTEGGQGSTHCVVVRAPEATCVSQGFVRRPPDPTDLDGTDVTNACAGSAPWRPTVGVEHLTPTGVSTNKRD